MRHTDLLQSAMVKRSFDLSKVVGRLRTAAGLESAATPLFGEEIANLAKRHGVASSTWHDLGEFGTMKERKALARHTLKETGAPGYVGFTTKEEGSGSVHNLRNFKGVFADVLGYSGDNPRLFDKIRARGGRVLGGTPSQEVEGLFNNKLNEAKVLAAAGGAN